jgi:hypothetical protein
LVIPQLNTQIEDMNNPWLVIPHVSAVVVANILEYLPNMVVFESWTKRVAACQIMTLPPFKVDVPATLEHCGAWISFCASQRNLA